MKKLLVLIILIFASMSFAQQTSKESIFDTIETQNIKTYKELSTKPTGTEYNSTITALENQKKIYYNDLTLTNKRKIQGLGLLFATLGATGIIANIIDANRSVTIKNGNTNTKIKNKWNRIHTFSTCYHSFFLISGLAITINY